MFPYGYGFPVDDFLYVVGERNRPLLDSIAAALGKLEGPWTLDAALKQLSDTDQRLLSMFYNTRCSYAEIGVEFGISENSVGPRLNRARNRLRAVLTSQRSDSP